MHNIKTATASMNPLKKICEAVGEERGKDQEKSKYLGRLPIKSLKTYASLVMTMGHGVDQTQ